MSIVMDKYESMEEQQTLRYFSFVFGLSQFFGAMAVILMAIWMGSYGDGFGWDQPQKQFHYHPLFMTLGLIFLYGEAILVYRVFRHERKSVTKIAHVVLHTVIFIFFVVALKAIFDAHNKQGLGHGSSLHGWVGLGTVLLFCCQYVIGFVTFFYPGLAMPVRQWYLPIHKYFGVAIFILAASAALMGITEHSRGHGHEKQDHSSSSERTLANVVGLCVVFYTFTVVYLVANPKFRRRPLPEEESHQQLVTD